jgi:hypothetical protein
MNEARRKFTVIAAGCLTGFAALAAYLGWLDAGERPTAVPGAIQQTAQAPERPVARTAPPAVGAAALTCPSEPLLHARGAADGQYGLQTALTQAADARPSAFLAVAREAARYGRVRDAEVALLAACHVAERASGPLSAPVADAKSQLGQHYAALAGQGLAAGNAALDERASRLLAESARAYAAALGRNASRTRLAERQLAAVTMAAALRAPAEETARMGAAAANSEATQRREAAVAPLLVRADPDLERLDADLQRLQAQALRVSRDPAGLRRRDAQAVAQRDARCRDKACLQQWYAQRRRQLFAEF